MSLDGKRVLIIGGSSGIGLAVAKEASFAGAEVIISSRSTLNLHEASQMGVLYTSVACDFTDVDSVTSMFEKVKNIDHLVVTAFSLPTSSGFKADRELFESKFWGSFYSAKIGKDYISKNGSITLTSGAYSNRSSKGFSTMSAINSAIDSLGKGLAIDLDPIRVNVVSPGAVRTPLLESFFDIKQLQHTLSQQLVQKLCEPEVVAQAYLLAMTNTFMTGSIILADGGYSLGVGKSSF